MRRRGRLRHARLERLPLRFACVLLIAAIVVPLALVGCSHAAGAQPGVVLFLVESMPTNLDPRIGIDAQSERIDSLIFSGLLERDSQMNIRGDLADSWENPDPLTYVFHLHPGVRFHDGRSLTSADVKYTFDSVISGAANSPKRGTFRMVRSVEAPDPLTVVFRLSEPYTSFVWSLTRPSMGIVPKGAGADFASHPIGSGAFRFVRAQQDEEVVLQRNPDYFRDPPHIEQVNFRIVPDAVVRALELRKGSADLEVNTLTPDMITALRGEPSLAISESPGTNYSYIGINFNDSILARREVRQALAYATDRQTIIRYLLRGQARLADGLLPPENWAYDPNVARYPYDPARAEQLLDAAGFPRRGDLGGMRMHLVLKSSTEEASRALGAVLQDQWRRVGIGLEVRSMEIATLLSDVDRGDFQLCYLRWVGANEDPDIFEYVFSSRRMPPNGANRGHYRNPMLDALLDQARVESDRERRRRLFAEIQQIVASDLPYLNLWFNDNVSVHRVRIRNTRLTPSGDYDFLSGIETR